MDKMEYKGYTIEMEIWNDDMIGHPWKGYTIRVLDTDGFWNDSVGGIESTAVEELMRSEIERIKIDIDREIEMIP